MAEGNHGMQDADVQMPVNENQHGAAVFFAAMLLSTWLLHLITIARSPLVITDEVQIIDYGRALVDRASPWALTLDLEGRPVYSTVPVYAWLVWRWLGVAGISVFAARLLSSACAVGAATAFWKLVRSQGTGAWLSAVVALGLWSDLLFVSSFRAGRADAFALLLCFLACWAWKHALTHASSTAAFLAGTGAVIALLSWRTSAVPLLLGVSLYLEAVWDTRRLFLKNVLLAVFGAMVSFALCAVCFPYVVPQLPAPTGAEAARYPDGHPLHGTILSTVATWYQFSPWVILWLFASAGVGVWNGRGRGMVVVIAAGLALAWMFPPFYIWRLLYVVPFFYLLMAKVLSWPRMPQVLFASLVVPSLLLNLGVHTVTGVAEWEERDFGQLEEELTSVIPNDAVVVGRWGHYYVGMHHGWRMYSQWHFEKIADEFDSFYLLTFEDAPLPDWAASMKCERLARIDRRPKTNDAGRQSAGRGYVFDIYLCSPHTPAGSAGGSPVEQPPAEHN